MSTVDVLIAIVYILCAAVTFVAARSDACR